MILSRKLSLSILFSFTTMILMIVLEITEIKMCKSFNIYRIFTINSTVCSNISIGVSVLEKLLTTSLITIGTFVFQYIIGMTSKLNIGSYNQRTLMCYKNNTGDLDSGSAIEIEDD